MIKGGFKKKGKEGVKEKKREKAKTKAHVFLQMFDGGSFFKCFIIQHVIIVFKSSHFNRRYQLVISFVSRESRILYGACWTCPVTVHSDASQVVAVRGSMCVYETMKEMNIINKRNDIQARSFSFEGWAIIHLS